MCDVVWDKPFIGGSPLDGLVPDRRGYRIPQYSLLNLGKYKKQKDIKSDNKNGQKNDDENGEEIIESNNYNHGTSSPRNNQYNRNQKIQIKQRYMFNLF